jgi:hypothetical protein
MLEVNMQPEGPAAEQCNQVSPKIFFGPWASADLVLKFRIALQISHADFPILASTFHH